MFQDFAKRKLNDYLGLLEFPDNKIFFEQVRHSALPPYIISFIDNYFPDKNIPIDRNEFEALLRKALIFNINYVIRPKYSILRFLFGEVETRPAEFILNKLKYFQFYGYYIIQITEFININSLEVVSVTHIQRVIDEVNKKILEEISEQSGKYSHRLNLIKLLYYFFIDLSENNPINIKLPKKILSVYFADKGFDIIKDRFDNFFSDEVFIQEAIELMTPGIKRREKAKTESDVSEQQVKEIISKAKSRLINRESSKSEIEKILKTHEQAPEITGKENVSELREITSRLPVLEDKKLIIDENIYSDELHYAAQFNETSPSAKLTEEEIRENLINDLFCENTYRKKIIKRLFSKEENKFKTLICTVLQQKSWHEAVIPVEDFFNKNKIDYYSEEAVKFVDILQSYFSKGKDIKENIKAV